MPPTGPIENWQANPLELGPLYPFVEWEVAMSVICLFIFVVFIVWKFKSEGEEYKSQTKRLTERSV